MKSLKVFLALVLLFSGLNLWSQIAINPDGSDPDPSSMLDVQSTNSGVLIPRMSAIERDAIPNPAPGLMVYVTELSLFYYYDGNKSGWMPLGSGGSGGDGWQITGTDMYSTVSGKVGIGTTSPGYKLTVDGGHGLIKGLAGWNTNGDQARLYLGDGNHSLFAVHSQGLRIRTHNTAGHSIRWGGSNGVDYMTLKMESGYLGIGTTDPGAKLDVRGWNVDDGVLIQTGNSDMSHKLVLFGGKQSDPNPFILWKDGDPLRFCTDQGGWSEKMRIASNGWIGIGTEDPKAPLHITSAPGNLRGQLSITDPIGEESFITFYNTNGPNFKSYIGHINGNAEWSTDDGSNIILSGNPNSGNVGISVSNPDLKLHIEGGTDISPAGGGYFQIGPTGGLNIGMDNNEIMARNNSGIADLHINREGGNIVLNEEAGNVGIGTYPSAKLHVNGTAKCKILQITGGADLAEPFDIIEHENVQPGMVMVIDPENPGKLKISEKEYDRCVAGIISGAGEINPGMIMGQTESIADGDHPVALSGRVYCYAETSNGNIQPGDLITTSNTPGYAMKSMDSQKAQGAIIGKAMTSLDSGKGLILVLVTLQ